MSSRLKWEESSLTFAEPSLKFAERADPSMWTNEERARAFAEWELMHMKEQSSSMRREAASNALEGEPLARKFMAMMSAKEHADLDTVSVSTHATTTATTFNGSGTSGLSSFESTTDSAELKEAMKPAKEKRPRRNENP